MLKVLAQLRGQQIREEENILAGGGKDGGGSPHKPLALLIAGGKGRSQPNSRWSKAVDLVGRGQYDYFARFVPTTVAAHAADQIDIDLQVGTLP